jgi:hypothetical protein
MKNRSILYLIVLISLAILFLFGELPIVGVVAIIATVIIADLLSNHYDLLYGDACANWWLKTANPNQLDRKGEIITFPTISSLRNVFWKGGDTGKKALFCLFIGLMVIDSKNEKAGI